MNVSQSCPAIRAKSIVMFRGQHRHALSPHSLSLPPSLQPPFLVRETLAVHTQVSEPNAFHAVAYIRDLARTECYFVRNITWQSNTKTAYWETEQWHTSANEEMAVELECEKRKDEEVSSKEMMFEAPHNADTIISDVHPAEIKSDRRIFFAITGAKGAFSLSWTGEKHGEQNEGLTMGVRFLRVNRI